MFRTEAKLPNLTSSDNCGNNSNNIYVYIVLIGSIWKQNQTMKAHEYSELTWALLSSYHWLLELNTNHVEQASVSASFLIHLFLIIKRFTYNLSFYVSAPNSRIQRKSSQVVFQTIEKRNRFRFLSLTLWMQFKQFYDNQKSLKVSKVEPIHSATWNTWKKKKGKKVWRSARRKKQP